MRNGIDCKATKSRTTATPSSQPSRWCRNFKSAALDQQVAGVLTGDRRIKFLRDSRNIQKYSSALIVRPLRCGLERRVRDHHAPPHVAHRRIVVAEPFLRLLEMAADD